MDREYLEDYEQKELAQYERFAKGLLKKRFLIEKGTYPPRNRFPKLQKPVALAAHFVYSNPEDLWGQVPFCGSLLLALPPLVKAEFEKQFFSTSEIPKIIEFIKETGRLQVVINFPPTRFVGLDHLDLFFTELQPPFMVSAPLNIYGTFKEIKKEAVSFYALAKSRYTYYLRKLIDSSNVIPPKSKLTVLNDILEWDAKVYAFLKINHYIIAQDIENLLADDPGQADILLDLTRVFIVDPKVSLLHNLTNYSLQQVKRSRILPITYQPENVRFPCEIGKFLLKKLTYAPQGLRACYNLIDHYAAYDLQKILESLNEGIVTNHPDIVNKNTEDFSEILDNVWNDRTIPRRIKGLQFGIPLSMAAIGSIAAGPIGAAGGFLAGLGYSVADKFIDLETEGLSERLAKLKTKSYQANVYDFKKKYKYRIAREQS